MGNLLLLLLIRADSRLHTPMYFFLSNLSLLDLCFSSVTVPKLLKDLLSEKKTISVEGCLTQIFFVFITAGTEAFLLSVMAYDRYAAICHPLLYGQVMSNQLCVRLVLASWGLASLNSAVIVLLAVNLDFCDAQTIHHYTCELPSLFPLSCSDISINVEILICSIILHGFGTFLPIFFSYACIVSTILSISSTTGRVKAFSTCSSHLIAVILFFGSGLIRYLLPPSGSSLDLLSSLQYSTVTPMLNPLIYSLKNTEVMAYDRFQAVCHPLLYVVAMNRKVCTGLVGASLAIGMGTSLVSTILLAQQHFCGPNLICSFACELPPVLVLACSDTSISVASILTTMAVLGLGTLVLLLRSYTHIIMTALGTNSAVGWSKIFSTCSSHFLVVAIFYGSGVFRYMTPASGSVLEQVFSVQYSVVTPLLNPLIYSLKNREVKAALSKMLARRPWLPV
ncbi:Olfactory Receptor 8S1 [Manis pentadactyla]|nr:Olfactory Receptor 8S1 [Manis pentadactyla]